MLREPSGSTSHPSMASNRDSSAGGSSSRRQSTDDSSAGKLVTSSLNVLAKPFVGPGTDRSDSQSLALKSPRTLPIMPGPCPSQVQDMHLSMTRHANADCCLTQTLLPMMQAVLRKLQVLCMGRREAQQGLIQRPLGKLGFDVTSGNSCSPLRHAGWERRFISKGVRCTNYLRIACRTLWDQQAQGRC